MKTIKQLLVILIATSTMSCVQETHLKTFYFKVDMKGVSNINNPGIRGQFTSPAWETVIPLTDANNDSIYEAKVEFTAAQYDIKFKFVNNGEYELKDLPNRSIKFEYDPETFEYKAQFDNPKHETIKQ